MKLQTRVLAAALLLAHRTVAFVPQNCKPNVARSQRIKPLLANQFDVSRPVFDLLSLRSIRGDALIRYDALNQSEPLRITLYALLALSFFAAPSLSEAVGYDDMSTAATFGSYAFGVSSVGLWIRECTRRSKQLNRIEKELNTESLPVRLPTNLLSDVPFSRLTTLKELRRLPNPPRIIAVSGTREKLEEALRELSILGRRLQQATVFVIAIPTDGSKVSDLLASSSLPWLADAYDSKTWQDYFQSLTTDGEETSTCASFQWFGLNSSGRSFGSGQDAVPSWIQILGQHLRPTEFLDESDNASVMADPSLLRSLESFYLFLTTGDSQGISSIFSSNEAPLVSEVSL